MNLPVKKGRRRLSHRTAPSSHTNDGATMKNVWTAQSDSNYFAGLDAFIRTVREIVTLPPLDFPQPKNRTPENPVRAPQPDERPAATLRHFL